jgi:co-chaperonin GroES (HSP10)
MLVLPMKVDVEVSEDVVFVQLYRETQTIKGSKLIRPETAQREAFFAKVISVGVGRLVDIVPGVRDPETGKLGPSTAIRRPMNLEPGDHVILSKFHGERLSVDGKACLLLRRDDILSKIHVKEEDLKDHYELCGSDDMSDEMTASLQRLSIQ